MSEKKELNGWHGALFGTLGCTALISVLYAAGALTPNPEEVAAHARELKILDAAQLTTVGKTSMGQKIERFYDPETRLVCYTLGTNSISCTAPYYSRIEKLEAPK